MNVYQTDLNGVFVGATTADQDPLDSTNWLIPAGCVETAPPTITDKQFAKWDGAKWAVENIPVVKPDPEPKPLSEAETVRAKRNQLLFESDGMALADRITDEWRVYRQALRDVPQQSGFPSSVTWPTEPS
tara:strand:- start:57 stop:446 length:390 start_codon:yes stop_codon:yes gene_type:complete